MNSKNLQNSNYVKVRWKFNLLSKFNSSIFQNLSKSSKNESFNLKTLQKHYSSVVDAWHKKNENDLSNKASRQHLNYLLHPRAKLLPTNFMSSILWSIKHERRRRFKSTSAKKSQTNPFEMFLSPCFDFSLHAPFFFYVEAKSVERAGHEEDMNVKMFPTSTSSWLNLLMLFFFWNFFHRSSFLLEKISFQI